MKHRPPRLATVRCLASTLGVLFLAGLAATPAAAQSSASWVVEQGTFNNGGNPEPVLASPGSAVTLDSIGDSIFLTGASSPSWVLDSGWAEAWRPPAEVLNLRFPTKTGLTWNPDPAVGSYAVYQGTIGSWNGFGDCHHSGLTAPADTDPTLPSPGGDLFFVVTARNRIGEEGPKGYASDGTLESNPSPCP